MWLPCPHCDKKHKQTLALNHYSPPKYMDNLPRRTVAQLCHTFSWRLWTFSIIFCCFSVSGPLYVSHVNSSKSSCKTTTKNHLENLKQTKRKSIRRQTTSQPNVTLMDHWFLSNTEEVPFQYMMQCSQKYVQEGSNSRQPTYNKFQV